MDASLLEGSSQVLRMWVFPVDEVEHDVGVDDGGHAPRFGTCQGNDFGSYAAAQAFGKRHEDLFGMLLGREKVAVRD